VAWQSQETLSECIKQKLKRDRSFLHTSAVYQGQKEKSMHQTTRQVPASAKDICPVLIGATVPKLTLTTVNGSSFDLNAAITEKPTVLIFYRGGW
jgi:hypothetical protein